MRIEMKFLGGGLLLIGWLLAVIFGYGFDVHRMVVGVPFMVIAGCLFSMEVHRRLTKPVLSLLWLTAGYFFVRAYCSPVAELGVMDAILVGGFVVSFLGGACLRSNRFFFFSWVALMGGLLAAHLICASIQLKDPSFALFDSPRKSVEGVSGMYWHRNYLAGWLGFVSAVFLALTLFSQKRWKKAVFGVITLVAQGLVFFTNSRGGMLASCVGLLIVGSLYGGLYYRGQSTNGYKKRLKKGGLILVLIGLCVMSVLSVFMVQRMFQERGKTFSMSAMFDDGVRIPLAGMGFDQWLESPVFGSGSRSFSYWSNQHWNQDKLPPWLRKGEAEMVHNDYIQTLAEYGLVGFILIVFFFLVVLYELLGKLFLEEGKGRSRHFEVAALAIMGATMVHSCADFNLHVLPNLMLFAFIIGSALSSPSPDQLNREETRLSHSWLDRGWTVIGVIACLWLGTLSARYWVATPLWFQTQRAEILLKKGQIQDREAVIAKQKQLFEKSPSARRGRELAKMMRQEPGLEEEKNIQAKEVSEVLERTLRLDPYDGLSWLYLARTRVFLLQDNAEEAYQRALVLLARRERGLGLMHEYAEYHERLAELAWKKRGRASEALMHFELAHEFYEKSWSEYYQKGGKTNYQKKIEALKIKENILRMGQIKASSREAFPSAEDYYDVQTGKYQLAKWKWDVQDH